ncbi:hypothetical protein EAE99_000815 [Botrytis elliptica]|nr:hypothetical protein EAE99_000815 [Botrytis elliptica]
MGTHSCTGNNLSLVQLRSVIATFLTRYDISFGPNEDNSTNMLESWPSVSSLGHSSKTCSGKECMGEGM